MNLSELTKEQKQYIILGVIGSVIVLGLVVFGFKATISSASESKTELEELTRKIETSDRTLSKRAATRNQYKESREILDDHLNHMPPDRNSYSWATEIIYATARRAGLEVDAVDEASIATPLATGKKKKKKKAAEVELETYRLRIAARGSFADAKLFFAQLEGGYPLARFSGVEINTGSNPEIHGIQFYVEWPIIRGELFAVWQSIDDKRKEAGIRSPSKAAAKVPLEKPESVVVEEPVEEPVSDPVVLPEETPVPVTPEPIPQPQEEVAEVVQVEKAEQVPETNSASENKLESMLQDQSKKDEESWNAFLGTLQGGPSENP